jgi:type VI secretion system protein
MANGNQPIAVDLLLVRDKDLIKKLATLTAADWFENRAQFLRDYPDPKDLRVFHREWVPGQIVPCANFVLVPMPKAAMVFANYFTKGDHRARLRHPESSVIHLLEDDFQILPVKDCNRLTCPQTNQ